MSDDLFATVYSEDLDEDVRPHRHAAHLSPFVGTYEVLVTFSARVEAPSKAAARTLIEQAVAQGHDVEEAAITASAPTYSLISVRPGETDRSRPGNVLRDCRAYVWFQARHDGDFRAAMQALTRDLFAELDQPAPDAPAATTTTVPATPKRKPRLHVYAVESQITIRCARTVWAEGDDEDDAEAIDVLDEDVRAMLYTECIDKWTDDQQSVVFAITGVERQPKASA